MKKAIFGFGGHAREVIAQMQTDLTIFVDDEYVVEGCHPISDFDTEKFEIMIAISNPNDRIKVIQKLPPHTKYFSWIHPSVKIMDSNVEIGVGSFIGANSILTTNIKIGKHAILNRGNQIGHDCIIGDYFSAMPGSVVSGNVSIGDRVYLGTNSSVKEKINICSDVTLGLNSGVVKDIKEKGTYVGTPSVKIS